MLLKKIFSALTALTLLCALAVGFAAPAAAYTLPEDVRLNARAAAGGFLGGSAEEDAFIYEKDADAVHAPAALVRLMAGAYTLKQVKEKNSENISFLHQAIYKTNLLIHTNTTVLH